MAAIQASQYLRPPSDLHSPFPRPHSRNQSRPASATSFSWPMLRNRSADPPRTRPTSPNRATRSIAHRWSTTQDLRKEPRDRWPFILKTLMPELWVTSHPFTPFASPAEPQANHLRAHRDDLDQLRSAMLRGPFGKEVGVVVIRTHSNKIEASFCGRRGLLQRLEEVKTLNF